MSIILGIDPGLQHTGWGVISKIGNQLKYIDSGVISPDVKLEMSQRIFFLHNALKDIISKYQPNSSALEEVYVNTNSSSSLKLGQARGAIILSMAICGVHISEYATRLVKKSVVGVGSADKKQVLAMVKILLPNANVASFDASDALATAICHANHFHFSNLDRKNCEQN